MFHIFIIITKKNCIFFLHALCYCIWSFVFSLGFYVPCLELNLGMSFHCSFSYSCVCDTTNHGFKFSFTFHIIITIDEQTWISIHCYGVVVWKHVHVLFTLDQLVKGGTSTNIEIFIFSIEIT
jgi:hypothetical protein